LLFKKEDKVPRGRPVFCILCCYVKEMAVIGLLEQNREISKTPSKPSYRNIAGNMYLQITIYALT